MAQVLDPTRTASRPRPRSAAPDLARGLGLLGIAVVNAPLLAPAAVDGTADRVSAVAVTLLVENRTWPMFALMFGFGIAAIAARLDAQGLDRGSRNRVLRRRCWWLLLVGAAQVVLVFWGDILGVYGLTGLVVVALLGRSPRVQAAWGLLGATLWGLGTVAMSWGGVQDEVPHSAHYLVSIGERLEVFVLWTGLNGVFVTHLAPMLVGVAFFRLGVLARPTDHRRLLRRTVGVTVPLGVVGALPAALALAGTWQPSDHARAVALGLQAVTGLAQGVGYVCVLALLVARHPTRTRLPAEIGRRSLTVYLVHSLLLGLLLSAWALDLAPHLGLASTYALGAGVWVVCAGVALLLAAVGRPGPADQLLRRLTYGRAAR